MAYWVGSTLDLKLNSVSCQFHSRGYTPDKLPPSTGFLLKYFVSPIAGGMTEIYDVLWLMLFVFILDQSIRKTEGYQKRLNIIYGVVMYLVAFLFVSVFAFDAAFGSNMHFAIYGGDSGDPLYDEYVHLPRLGRYITIGTILLLWIVVAGYCMRFIIGCWRKPKGVIAPKVIHPDSVTESLGKTGVNNRE